MKIKAIQKLTLFGLIILLTMSCANDINLSMPKGPKGDKGDKGESGMSAFELWKQFYGKDPSTSINDFFASFKGKDGKDGLDGKDGINGQPGDDGLTAYDQWLKGIEDGYVYDHDNNIYKGNTTLKDYFEWMKGRNGTDGKDGQDGSNGTNGTDGKDGTNGLTPKIGSNGNWWIGDTDTKVPAQGKDGQNGTNGTNGLTPTIKDGIWWIGNTNTGVPTTGKNGTNGESPSIKNGFWWVGKTNTGIPAQGKDGQNGTNGTNGLTPTIKDGYWWIGNTNTGVPTTGKDGQDGTNGLTPTIKDGIWWIGTTNTGIPAQGKDGQNGTNGTNGLTPTIKDGIWWIGTTNTGIPAQGKDGQNGTNGTNGLTPSIKNGYWWIGDKNTGVKAEGKDGQNGTNGTDGKDGQDGLTPHIGKNGNWWIGDHDTKIPARGKDGQNGSNGIDGQPGAMGLDAYEVWKRGIEKNQVLDHDGKLYKGDNSIDAYYEWLKGRDGKDGTNGTNGTNGTDGKDGVNGLTPTIKDGYWWIGDSNTGVPTTGKNGENGETPSIKNGIWWIGNTNTGIPAQGKDGQNGTNGTDGKDGQNGTNGTNGLTPTIKDGYWWIGDKNTGIKAEGKDGQNGTNGTDGKDGQDGENGTNGTDGKDGVNGLTPSIKDGNWWIGDKDTGIKAEGKDGLNGDSAYELWKDAVINNMVWNHDGSKYEGGNSWKDYLKWLQRGDASALHEYWITLPGNEGKTIQDFITELFSCHCDQVKAVVVPNGGCVVVDEKGDFISEHPAFITLSGPKGTKVVIKDASGKELLNKVLAGEDIPFEVNQTEKEQTLTMAYTAPDKNESKEKLIRIPALKSSVSEIKLIEPDVSSTRVAVQIYITNLDNVKSVTINEKPINDGVDGWSKTDYGFKKVFDKDENDHAMKVNVKGNNGSCTYANFILESIEKVKVNSFDIKDYDECDFKIIITGDAGLIIVSQTEDVRSTEVSPGRYEVLVPKEFTEWVWNGEKNIRKPHKVTLTISKPGFGSLVKEIEVLQELDARIPIYASPLTTGEHYASEQIYEFQNYSQNEIRVVLSRNENYSKDAIQRDPWVEHNQTYHYIPGNGSIQIKFKRDYTPRFEDGQYFVNISTETSCGKEYKSSISIRNQSNFRHSLKLLNDDYGYGPGIIYENGVRKVRFQFDIEDGIPNSFAQLLLLHNGDLTKSVINQQVGSDGYLSMVITMDEVDFNTAVQSGKGQIMFSKDKFAKDMLHTKEIDFNL